jgi:hypothetical protein
MFETNTGLGWVGFAIKTNATSFLKEEKNILLSQKLPCLKQNPEAFPSSLTRFP